MIDLAIIGGGISGLGVAMAAARGGHSAVVFETGVCGAATSNNTLRIIHGGFRYLQSFDIPRVFQSLRDQRDLLREIPEAVAPLPCLMPLKKWGAKSRIPVTMAGVLYGLAASMTGSPLSWPRVLGRNEIEGKISALSGMVPHGALCWNDVLMREPAGVLTRLRDSIVNGGVSLREGCSVTRVERSNGGFTVHLGSGESVDARFVVNTAGPKIGSIELPADMSRCDTLWCKGFNLIVRKGISSEYGVGVEGADGRLFFVVPRGEGAAIGTWYLPVASGSAAAVVNDSEIETFVASFNAAMPGFHISQDDVVGTDVGILPMLRDSTRGPVLRGSEDIRVTTGYAEVLSTKYTTFRSQGERVLRSIGL